MANRGSAVFVRIPENENYMALVNIRGGNQKVYILYYITYFFILL